MTSLSANTALIEERIQKLCDALKENYYKKAGSRPVAYDIERGVKYYKIIMVDNPGGNPPGRSVHAFIARQTGAVYKPASWKAPAKHVRYNLLDDQSFETCLHNADWAGGYLYMR
jgi:hypothetical protein